MSNSVTPWTVAHQAPLSKRFPRQAYWSGLPFPPPGHPPDPGIKPRSPALAGSFFTIWATMEVNTSLCIWYATIDLANEFFPILVNMVHQNQLAFSCLDQQYTSTLLYQQVYQFSGPRSKFNLQESLSLFLFTRYNVDPLHWFIMLIGSSDQDIATTLDLLTRHSHDRVWETNLRNTMRGPLPKRNF